MQMCKVICQFLMLVVLVTACDSSTKPVDSCGDGFLDPGEACDGGLMTAATCAELGYYGQTDTLSCRSDCTFDLSVCTEGRCGDGRIQSIHGEQCEGTDLSGATCANQGLGGGELFCGASCRFDVSRCELAAQCGDHMAASPYEPCDGTDLAGQTCATQGFVGGVLGCNDDCTGFDTTRCTNCGDGLLDDGEVCDGAAMDGQTCLTLGYNGGTLGCTASCAFDFSECEAPETCGDGQLDDGEQCDGTNLDQQTCVTLGFAGGDLGCRPNCTFSTTGCTNCGNGQLDLGEVCDGTNLNGQSCVLLGWYGGTLACAPDCRSFDDGSCQAAGRCGDGAVQASRGEVCDGAAPGSGTCATEGFYEGTLACGSDCRYVTTGCTGWCGDGTIQWTHGEDCDGANLGGVTCVIMGFSPRGGELACSSTCSWDTTGCTPIGTNAELATLTVSAGALAPSFSPGVTSYTVSVPFTVETLTAAGTAADFPWASVSVSPAQPMALVEGTNLALLTVRAEDGVQQRQYMVTITREPTLDYESPNVGTLRHVAAGTFQRDGTTTNLSVVSPFRMSLHAVTRTQWTTVTGWADPSDAARSSGPDDPVQQVNWYDAIAFCNKLSLLEGLTPVYSVSGVDFAALTYAQIPTVGDATWNAVVADWNADGYRLPTEMEWMWAAMGADSQNPGAINTTGREKLFSGSDGSNAIGDYVVFGYHTTEPGRTMTERTNPVDSKLPNELGFHDLSGNVWDLVWDWYQTYPAGTQTDYRGPATGASRLHRGGHWSGSGSYCSVAYRGYGNPSTRHNGGGFRVVRR